MLWRPDHRSSSSSAASMRGDAQPGSGPGTRRSSTCGPDHSPSRGRTPSGNCLERTGFAVDRPLASRAADNSATARDLCDKVNVERVHSRRPRARRSRLRALTLWGGSRIVRRHPTSGQLPSQVGLVSFERIHGLDHIHYPARRPQPRGPVSALGTVYDRVIEELVRGSPQDYGYLLPTWTRELVILVAIEQTGTERCEGAITLG